MSNLSPAAAHTGPDDYLTSSIGFLDQQHVEARSEAARRALGSGSGAVTTTTGEGRRRSCRRYGLSSGGAPRGGVTLRGCQIDPRLGRGRRGDR
jgi:hypothetical protein